MILNPSNIELTKVHYYDSFRKTRNIELIANRSDNNNKKLLIRRNIFGHKWVLHINDQQQQQCNNNICDDDVERNKRNKCLFIIYIIVIIAILIAILCGVWISVLEKRFYDYDGKQINRTTQIVRIVPKKHDVILTKLRNYWNVTKMMKLRTTIMPKKKICDCLYPLEICMKMQPLEAPKCVKSRDANDRTGCGGLCAINTQHCKLINRQYGIYECINNTNLLLKCPRQHFNCGRMCIDERKRCDGWRHCKDNIDELNCSCDLKANFHCGNGTSCLSRTKRCDGIVDCWDMSDEMNCNQNCLNDEVPCRTGKECIMKTHFCDGIRHCADGSDEPSGCV